MSHEELAASLRASFRGPCVEADEWRPLAEYVVQLLKAQREACAAAINDPYYSHLKREAAIERIRATPLVEVRP